MAHGKENGNTTGANLGFEARLGSMADNLRGSLDSSECGSLMIGGSLRALCQRIRMIVSRLFGNDFAVMMEGYAI